DFEELAKRFEASGGDIRNAVLRAAQMAAGEEGPDQAKCLHLRHFIAGMEQVLAAKCVMQQTIGDTGVERLPWQEAVEAAEQRLKSLDDDLHSCRTELEILVQDQAALAGRVETRAGEFAGRLEGLDDRVGQALARADAAGVALEALQSEVRSAAE